jgi:copper chaperone CopZ
MTNTQVKFTISGLHCQSCEKIVAKRIGKISGVQNVEVSFKKSELIVTTKTTISESLIQQTLSGTDYIVTK